MATSDVPSHVTKLYIGCELQYIYKRIKNLITEISKREKIMDYSEAKVFIDNLTLYYKQLVTAEMAYESKEGEYVKKNDRIKLEKGFNEYHLMLTNLQIKLAKIVSLRSPTSSAEINPNNPRNQTNQSFHSSTSNSQLQTQEQKFLIEQIESVEINDTVCAVKAQVLYDHVEKLYQRFISNQVQIDAQGDDAALVDQKTIASRTQRKVIEIQTELKKIIASNSPASNAKTEPESSNQFHQTEHTSEVGSLLKKQIFLVTQMGSLEKETADGCSADKAKVAYNHLTSIYEKIVSNHFKIEEHEPHAILDAQRNFLVKVQRQVIKQQTNLKKIFDPIPAQSFVDTNQRSAAPVSSSQPETDPRATELKTLNNLINLFNELLISQKTQLGQFPCANDSIAASNTSSRRSSTTTLDTDEYPETLGGYHTDDDDEMQYLEPTLNGMSWINSKLKGQVNDLGLETLLKWQDIIFKQRPWSDTATKLTRTNTNKKFRTADPPAPGLSEIPSTRDEALDAL